MFINLLKKSEIRAYIRLVLHNGRISCGAVSQSRGISSSLIRKFQFVRERKRESEREKERKKEINCIHLLFCLYIYQRENEKNMEKRGVFKA